MWKESLSYLFIFSSTNNITESFYNNEILEIIEENSKLEKILESNLNTEQRENIEDNLLKILNNREFTKNFQFILKNFHLRDMRDFFLWFFVKIGGMVTITVYFLKRILNQYQEKVKSYLYVPKLVTPIVEKSLFDFMKKKGIREEVLKEYTKNSEFDKPFGSELLTCAPEVQRELDTLLEELYNFFDPKNGEEKQKLFIDCFLQMIINFNNMKNLTEKIVISNEDKIKYIETIENFLTIFYNILNIIPENLHQSVKNLSCYFTYHSDILVKSIINKNIVPEILSSFKSLKERRRNNPQPLMRLSKETDTSGHEYIDVFNEENETLNFVSILDLEFIIEIPKWSNVFFKEFLKDLPEIFRNIAEASIRSNSLMLVHVFILPTLFYHNKGERLKHNLGLYGQNPQFDMLSIFITELNLLQQQKKDLILSLFEKYLINNQLNSIKPGSLIPETKTQNELVEKPFQFENPMILKQKFSISNNINKIITLTHKVLENKLSLEASRLVMFVFQVFFLSRDKHIAPNILKSQNITDLLNINFGILANDNTLVKMLFSEIITFLQELKNSELLPLFFEKDSKVNEILNKCLSLTHYVKEIVTSDITTNNINDYEDVKDKLREIYYSFVNKEYPHMPKIRHDEQIDKKIEIIIISVSNLKNFSKDKYKEFLLAPIKNNESLFKSILYLFLYYEQVKKIYANRKTDKRTIENINAILKDNNSVNKLDETEEIKKITNIVDIICSITETIINSYDENQDKVTDLVHKFFTENLKKQLEKMEQNQSLEIYEELSNSTKRFLLDILKEIENLDANKKNDLIHKICNIIHIKTKEGDSQGNKQFILDILIKYILCLLDDNKKDDYNKDILIKVQTFLKENFNIDIKDSSLLKEMLEYSQQECSHSLSNWLQIQEGKEHLSTTKSVKIYMRYIFGKFLRKFDEQITILITDLTISKIKDKLPNINLDRNILSKIIKNYINIFASKIMDNNNDDYESEEIFGKFIEQMKKKESLDLLSDLLNNSLIDKKTEIKISSENMKQVLSNLQKTLHQESKIDFSIILVNILEKFKIDKITIDAKEVLSFIPEEKTSVITTFEKNINLLTENKTATNKIIEIIKEEHIYPLTTKITTLISELIKAYTQQDFKIQISDSFVKRFLNTLKKQILNNKIVVNDFLTLLNEEDITIIGYDIKIDSIINIIKEKNIDINLLKENKNFIQVAVEILLKIKDIFEKLINTHDELKKIISIQINLSHKFFEDLVKYIIVHYNKEIDITDFISKMIFSSQEPIGISAHMNPRKIFSGLVLRETTVVEIPETIKKPALEIPETIKKPVLEIPENIKKPVLEIEPINSNGNKISIIKMSNDYQEDFTKNNNNEEKVELFSLMNVKEDVKEENSTDEQSSKASFPVELNKEPINSNGNKISIIDRSNDYQEDFEEKNKRERLNVVTLFLDISNDNEEKITISFIIPVYLQQIIQNLDDPKKIFKLLMEQENLSQLIALNEGLEGCADTILPLVRMLGPIKNEELLSLAMNMFRYFAIKYYQPQILPKKANKIEKLIKQYIPEKATIVEYIINNLPQNLSASIEVYTGELVPRDKKEIKNHFSFIFMDPINILSGDVDITFTLALLKKDKRKKLTFDEKCQGFINGTRFVVQFIVKDYLFISIFLSNCSPIWIISFPLGYTFLLKKTKAISFKERLITEYIECAIGITSTPLMLCYRALTSCVKLFKINYKKVYTPLYLALKARTLKILQVFPIFNRYIMDIEENQDQNDDKDNSESDSESFYSVEKFSFSFEQNDQNDNQEDSESRKSINFNERSLSSIENQDQNDNQDNSELIELIKSINFDEGSLSLIEIPKIENQDQNDDQDNSELFYSMKSCSFEQNYQNDYQEDSELIESIKSMNFDEFYNIVVILFFQILLML